MKATKDFQQKRFSTTGIKKLTDFQMLTYQVSKRICDYCGEEHLLMEDNKDGSFTCLSCLNKIDDGNDIDNCMGCDW